MSQTHLFRFSDLPLLFQSGNKTHWLNNVNHFLNNPLHLNKYLYAKMSLQRDKFAAVNYKYGRDSYWSGGIEFDCLSKTAWFDYLLESEKADGIELKDLLYFLIQKAGSAEMRFLAAEIDDGSWFEKFFRQCGFYVLFRQTIFSTTGNSILEENKLGKYSSMGITWQPITLHKFSVFDSLVCGQTPPCAEEIKREWKGKKSFGCYIAGKPSGVVTVQKKGNFLYMEPIFLPDFPDPSLAMISVAAEIGADFSSKLFVCIPSWQSWVIGSLSSEKWETCVSQNVFVRTMVVRYEEETLLQRIEKAASLPLKQGSSVLSKRKITEITEKTD